MLSSSFHFSKLHSVCVCTVHILYCPCSVYEYLIVCVCVCQTPDLNIILRSSIMCVLCCVCVCVCVWRHDVLCSEVFWALAMINFFCWSPYLGMMYGPWFGEDLFSRSRPLNTVRGGGGSSAHTHTHTHTEREREPLVVCVCSCDLTTDIVHGVYHCCCGIDHRALCARIFCPLDKIFFSQLFKTLALGIYDIKFAF